MATNSGAHRTRVIRRRQAENVFHAARFAAESKGDRPLLVTINFTDLGVEEEDAGPLFRDLRSRVVRRWSYLRQRGLAAGSFDDYYAHANPNERRHVHWVILSAPVALRAELQAVIRGRLRKLLAGAAVDDGLHFGDVTSQGSLTKYVLKGTEKEFGPYFHMWTSDEGEVSGRRTGTSRSIGHAARKRAGWRRKGPKPARR